MSKAVEVEDLEAFREMLQGPAGALLRQAGVAMARRMSERNVEWSDLGDEEVLDLFHSAFMQVASTSCPELSLEDVEALARTTFADMAQGLTVPADAGRRVH